MHSYAAVAAAIAAVAVAAVAARVLRARPGGAPAAFAVLLGCAVPAAVLKAYDIARTDGWTRRASSLGAEFTYVLVAFTLLGVVAARSSGWFALSPLGLVAGACLGLLALTPETEMEWAMAGVGAVVVCANLFGILARRRGVAIVAFVLCGLALLATLSGPALPAVAIGVGAVLGFASSDWRAGARLGGVAVGLGAFVGWGAITRGPRSLWLAVLVAAAIATVLAARLPGPDDEASPTNG